MRINLEYNQPKETTLSNAELTFDYITHAINKRHEKGLNSSQRRLWGRIQRKFDDAIEQKFDEVELEEAEIDFIKEAFRDVVFPASLAKFVVVLEDEIAKL